MHPSPNSPSDEDLESFEDLIGYRFRGRILAREALQITNALPGEGNKSLAMFGDAVLRMILIWQGRQQNQSELDISDYVRRKTDWRCLSERGFASSLEKYIVTRPGQTIIAADMAETVSAIIGAVFMDCGFGLAQCLGVMAQLGISWS